MVLIMGIALVGCSASKSNKSASSSTTNNSPSGATAGPGSTGGQEAADPNGTLTFGSAAVTAQPTFDIHTYAGGLTGWNIYTLVYDNLVQLSGNSLDVEPDLATSWTWNANDTQLTLKLERGVQFQDGSSFNADVAVANLKAAAAKGANTATQLANMTNVVAVDPYTVMLNFSAPSPSVLYDLAGYAGMVESPGGLADPSSLVQHPAGSGPYKLQSVSSSLTYTYVRWDEYWNKTHVFPETYIQPAYVNETTRLNAVENGAADATYITAQTYSSAVADKNLQISTYPGMESYNIYMNSHIAPLDNLQVREAISMALNRPAFNASQQGLCPPAYQAFEPGLTGYIDGYQGLGYDPAQAKQLIEQAGATGKTITLDTIPNQPFIALAEIAQSQLDAIGLHVTITQLPGASFRVQFAQGAFGLLFAPDSIQAPDPAQVTDTFYLGPMYPGVKDPAMVAEIQSAEQQPLGSPQRTTAFEQINRDLVTKYVPWAPVCEEVQVFVGNKKVIGLNQLPGAVFTAAPNEEYVQIGR
jgi:ABC-type transport system substrate-binding protein